MMKYKQNNNEVTTMEIDLPEESGRSKRKRVLRQLALNGILCGLVLNGLLEWSSNANKPAVRLSG